MKTIFRIFASLSLLVALASCQMYEIDTQVTPAQAAASLRMDCDALATYNIPALAPQPLTFNISANTPWRITRSEGSEWLAVSPTTSAAGGLITDVVMTPQANDGKEDRTAVLTLAGDGIESFTIIKVIQSRKGELEVIPLSKVFSAAGGQLPFTFTSNLDWEIKADVDWLSFSLAEGPGDGVAHHITITAAASDVLERTGNVTVTAGEESKSFAVSQVGKFDIAEPDGVIPSGGGNITFKLRTDLPWEIVPDKAWVTVAPESQDRGNGNWTDVTVTAVANEGAQRKANLKVIAGGEEKTIQVSQAGVAFNIVAPASTAVSPLGEVLMLEVNTALEWEPASDAAWMVVNKVDATHFTVTAEANNKFSNRSGNVSITSGAVTDALELSQATPFSFKGNYQMLEDGSVKLIGDQTSNITVTDGLRYASMTLYFSECHFSDAGNFWFENHVTGEGWGCQLYNWLTIGKTRLRAEGTVEGGLSMNPAGSYMSTDYTISKDELNAMTSYTMDVVKDGTDPGLLNLQFLYNGTSRCTAICRNPFNGNEVAGNAFIGFHATASADDWVVITSCDLVVHAE